MLAHKTVFTFLGIKLAVLLIVAGGYLGWLQFGERGLKAADGDQAEEKEEVSETSTEVAAEEKSVLGELLNLKKLSPDTEKKDEIGRYLSLAEQKYNQVQDRIEVLKKREASIRKTEQKLKKMLAALESERRQFAESVQKEKEIRGNRLENLTTFYSKMEPKKAAPIFEKMDKDLAVALLKKVKKSLVTKIFESMQPDESVKLTEYFGRVNSGREYDLLKEMNRALDESFVCKSGKVASR